MTKWVKVFAIGTAVAVGIGYCRREPPDREEVELGLRDPCLFNQPGSRTIEMERELLHYCEGKLWLTFDIYLIKRFFRSDYWKMYAPSPDCWTKRMPAWAARRRGEILGTIVHLGRERRTHIRLVDRPECPEH